MSLFIPFSPRQGQDSAIRAVARAAQEKPGFVAESSSLI
jgi:hypothetical protein